MFSDGERRRAYVPLAKVTRYLPCLDNGPEAAAKAAFFVRFGFDPRRPEDLIVALQRPATENSIREIWSDEWGLHFEVEGPLLTPDGRAPKTRTSWMQAHERMSPPRLITAFPI
ncbi:DUF6883 domain-containing protein [Methylobacterium radiodurans]|uniref:DUF6883 domain-containing protein n=1 Tax=Methylobacterium radiodurans TaxID=2202828 RepID=A0A2U8VRZ5_9HYPH|nr:DUF6883 domain-containing protein [Methylobacterium radiodurans]AWN36230.1 hypothetical protein DK427_11290 [Methylobacterium radiodurans]